MDPAGGPRRIRVGIIGATGYVGGELVRLLARHPNVELVGLVGRDRDHDPIGGHPPRTSPTLDLDIHAELPRRGRGLPRPARTAPRREHRPGPRSPRAPRSSTRAPTSASATPPTTRAGTASSTRAPTSSTRRSTACRSSTAPSSTALVDAPVAIVGAPGCYPTATLLALAPLARAGLIGDLVVDAKSGVSGAGREAKADLMFGEVNESVKAYGIGGHRHVAEIEQELAGIAARAGLDPSANPGIVAVDFLPHLIPMTRGILSACHVRPTRAGHPGRARRAVRDGLRATSRSSRSSPTPPATKHVTGSNEVRIHVTPRRADRADPRDRCRGQPRQGRRGPGDPGLQPRPRPARDGRPRPAAARAMTDPSRTVPVPASSTDLPPVERRAAIPPASGPAGWRPGSRPRAGRTSPLSSRRRVRPPRPPSSPRTRSRPRPSGCRRANLAATSGDPRGGFGWAERGDLDERLRERGDRRRRRRRPARDRGDARRGDRRPSPSGRSTCRPGSSGRGCRSRRSGRVSRRSSRRWPRPTTGCSRSRRRCARPIRVTKVATTTVELPAADGRAGDRPRQRDRQGRRDDPPADGDDAVGRADRRDGRARGPVGAAPAGRGADLGPALGRWRHEHERHRLRPRVRGVGGRAGRGPVRRPPASSAPRSRRSRATSRASRRPTARAPARSSRPR